MFEGLSERLSGVFDKLTKQGALSDADVSTALREVRVALLEAATQLLGDDQLRGANDFQFELENVVEPPGSARFAS